MTGIQISVHSAIFVSNLLPVGNKPRRYIGTSTSVFIMNLKGKYAVCVGATSGIGKGVALKLAQMQANVTVVGRNATLGEELLAELFKLNPSGDHGFIIADASSMKSIVQGCDDYLSKNKSKPLHFLVQSQGMASLNGRTETSEGIDQKLALHHYGRVLFHRQLGDKMKETALQSENNDVRSLSILSGGVHSAYDNLDDLDLKKNFTLTNAANAAGFYNDLTADQLSRDDDYLKALPPGSSADGKAVAPKRGISYIHAAPGVVATTWGKDFPWYALYPVRFLQLFAKSPETCATYMIEGGLINPIRQGQGFHIMSETGQSAHTTSLHNDKYREAVWKHTNEIIDKALRS